MNGCYRDSVGYDCEARSDAVLECLGGIHSSELPQRYLLRDVDGGFLLARCREKDSQALREPLELVQAEHLVHPVREVEDRPRLHAVVGVVASRPADFCDAVSLFVLGEDVLVVWVQMVRKGRELFRPFPSGLGVEWH